MRNLIIAIISAVVLIPTAASAQQGEEEIQRSSSPAGLRLRDGNSPAATSSNISAPAASTGNSGRATAIAGQGSVNLQGKTKIDAQAKDVNAITAGTQNRATNAVGNIGN